MKLRPSDFQKIGNPAQVGGIETSVLDNGPGQGCRIAWVNTGTPLRYKVAIDRGLDIGDAFFGPSSLTWLSYGGITAPDASANTGIGWLRRFGGGLVTSCGPLNAGAPCCDAGEQLGLHGSHSNTPASVESIIQPDTLRGRLDFSITGTVKTARVLGPTIELRRTISGRLGEAAITIRDEFFNRGNTAVPHAWLLHINLGWPLVEAGARLLYKGRVTPRQDSVSWFSEGRDFREVPADADGHEGSQEAVAYIEGGADKAGLVRVGLLNERLGLGLAVTFNEKQFPRWVNWQRFAHGEYVIGIEPANCGVEGRDVDRQRGWLDTMRPQETRVYETRIEVLDQPEQLEAMAQQ